SPLSFPQTPAPTESYTLSLHDALPILGSSATSRRTSPKSARSETTYSGSRRRSLTLKARSSDCSPQQSKRLPPATCRSSTSSSRSEEHTSELQSRENLVCRLLLEKKKK